MSGLDLSRLSPADGAVALRSYPRRFRALLTAVDRDERPDDVAHRAGPDGLSALDHASHVARAFGLIANALHQVLVGDRPVLPAGVVDDRERSWASALADADIADLTPRDSKRAIGP